MNALYFSYYEVLSPNISYQIKARRKLHFLLLTSGGFENAFLDKTCKKRTTWWISHYVEETCFLKSEKKAVAFNDTILLLFVLLRSSQNILIGCSVKSYVCPLYIEMYKVVKRILEVSVIEHKTFFSDSKKPVFSTLFEIHWAVLFCTFYLKAFSKPPLCNSKKCSFQRTLVWYKILDGITLQDEEQSPVVH